MSTKYIKEIKEAWNKVIQEKVKNTLIETVKEALDNFIKRYEDKFVSSKALRTAKSISSTLLLAEDETDLINRIVDISNLIEDDEKVLEELNTIIDMI